MIGDAILYAVQRATSNAVGNVERKVADSSTVLSESGQGHQCYHRDWSRLSIQSGTAPCDR